MWYPHLSGIENHNAVITSPEDLEGIINELKNTDYSLTDIGKHFGVKYGAIYDINNGFTYKQDNISYPIREFTLSKEKLDRLIYDLKYSNFTYEELGIMYNISTNQVKAINAGRSWHKDHLEYPLRRMVFSGDNETYEMIQKDLLSTNLNYDLLAVKYNCSRATIIRINTGETYFNSRLKYPLRKIGKLSSEDVEKIHHLLIDDEVSINDIAIMFNVSEATIKRINSGATKKYKDDNYSYPLRK